ncbi:hypothetical protein [Sanyastnella coralliicola]|uniref:hypothetical protein n=1 Tax=Sanyastnella coralliicola TaxID=3069118 RepID=UPI0027B992B7|nr:hypothetical protein [Longitalea sp. SCSIO 12813]
MRKYLFLTLTLLLICSIGYSQSTTANNVPGGNKFLGFDAAQAIDFRTNDINRAKLMDNGNITVNTYTYNRAGFFGLSQDPDFFNLGLQSPFTLLHLNGDNPNGAPEQLGFRDWMRYGILFTHNQDMMYVGPRRIGDDVTDVWAVCSMR